MSYDEKSAELARYFLSDEKDGKKLEATLAQVIQDAIESFLEDDKSLKEFDEQARKRLRANETR